MILQQLLLLDGVIMVLQRMQKFIMMLLIMELHIQAMLLIMQLTEPRVRIA